MPRASPADSFVWRAAARPDRARLLGAIAIAVSCGGLGLLAGRWSAQVAPAEPGRRTAALIEAVAKETPLERLRDVTSELQQLVQSLTAAQSAAGSRSGPDASPSAQGPSSPDADDVIDAEFTTS